VALGAADVAEGEGATSWPDGERSAEAEESAEAVAGAAPSSEDADEESSLGHMIAVATPAPTKSDKATATTIAVRGRRGGRA
jgi:hypothetical protein